MGRETRNLVIILGVLALIVVFGPLLGGGMLGVGGMMGPGMMWGQGGPGQAGGWGWGLAMGLGWLAMLAFWGTLIVGIVLLVRALPGSATGSRPRGEEDALAIVRRRYASGEITREQYEQLRQDLER